MKKTAASGAKTPLFDRIFKPEVITLENGHTVTRPRSRTPLIALLVIAALAAQGESEISNVQYIERGYEDIIGKLRALGAKIDCVEENDEPPIRQIG